MRYAELPINEVSRLAGLLLTDYGAAFGGVMEDWVVLGVHGFYGTGCSFVSRPS